MDLTPDAEALLGRLAEVAPAADVADVRAAAEREAMRLRHPLVVPGHVLTVLVRRAADPKLLADLGVPASVTPAQLLDRTKAEVDAAATGAAPPVTQGDFQLGQVRFEANPRVEPCPECGDTADRRHQTRRVPNPGGGRGAAMARIEVCGACGAELGVG